MAAPTNTYTTSSAVGLRENLIDYIALINPNDTLFQRAIGRTNALAITHEWQADSYSSPSNDAWPEGNDPDAEAISPTQRLSNTCQIQGKSFIISETLDAVNKAGRKTETAFQTKKKAKELAANMEKALLEGVESTTSPRKMKGALNWVTTNLNKASDATLNADGTVSGGTARALTVAIFKATCQDIYTSGGRPTLVYCNAFQKTQISDFVDTGNYRMLVEKAKMEDTIDIYVGDFGKYKVIPHRLMPTDVVFILDPDTWRKAILRPVKRTKLAKTGDNTKYMIRVEHTLEARAENANGRITNLTTS